MKEITCTPPPTQPAPDLQAGLQALYEGRKAGEVQLDDIACTPENIQQPKNWWQKAWDWTVDHTGKIVKSVKSGVKAWNVRNLKFHRLEDGHISVSANTPPGTRLTYRADVAGKGFKFAGTRYNPETVAATTGNGLLRGAVSKSSLVFSGLVSVGTNLLEFGSGKKFGTREYWDATVKNREFWVSTGVDFAVSVAVGVTAAAAVALFVGATTPLWLAVGATALVGIGIGALVERTGAPAAIKSWLNNMGK